METLMFWEGGVLAVVAGIIPALCGGWIVKGIAYALLVVVRFISYGGNLRNASSDAWISKWAETFGLGTCILILLGFGFYFTDEVANKFPLLVSEMRKRFWKHWLIPQFVCWGIVIISVLSTRFPEWDLRDRAEAKAIELVSQAAALANSGNTWSPEGRCAVDLYKAALEADRNNAIARTRLSQLANIALEKAQDAYQNNNLLDAEHWYSRVLPTGVETDRINSQRNSHYQLFVLQVANSWSTPIQADSDYIQIYATRPIEVEGVGAGGGSRVFWEGRNKIYTYSEKIRLRTATPGNPVTAKVFVTKRMSLHVRNYVADGFVQIDSGSPLQKPVAAPAARGGAGIAENNPASKTPPWPALPAPVPRTEAAEDNQAVRLFPSPPAPTPGNSAQQTTGQSSNFLPTPQPASQPKPPSSMWYSKGALPTPLYVFCRYYARLSLADHYNGKGQFLPDIPNIRPEDILLQDRLNFHRKRHRDAEDGGDPLYNQWGTTKFMDYFENGPLFVREEDAAVILRGQPVVEVTIAKEGIYVRLASPPAPKNTPAPFRYPVFTYPKPSAQVQRPPSTPPPPSTRRYPMPAPARGAESLQSTRTLDNL